MTYAESKRAIEELLQSPGWAMVVAAVKASIENERRVNDSSGAGDFWQEAARTAKIRGHIAGLRALLELPERILADITKAKAKE